VALALCTAASASAAAQRIDTTPIRCPAGQALVTGPPASELFDPDTPHSGHAVWCERYIERGRPVRQGAYRDYHPNGAPRTYARFRDDRLSGVLLVLHDNGRPWLHTVYRNGQLDGPYVIFSPSGAPWLEAEYERGRPIGHHVLYYEAGGVAAISEYRDGLEHGVSRAWHPNGRPRHEIEIVQGVWSGRFSRWHENGQIARRGEYAPCPAEAAAPNCQHLGAARHGPWQSWHANGRLASQGDWRFGERVGGWRYWTASGQPSATAVRQANESTQAEPAPPAGPARLMVPAGGPAAAATGHRFRSPD
jgi:antitoxin component YwqK of YwqJK toxin-antitoxin module